MAAQFLLTECDRNWKKDGTIYLWLLVDIGGQNF